MREPLCIASKNAYFPTSVPVVQPEDIENYGLQHVSFILVDLTEWRAGYRQLVDIRTNPLPHIYLKPVVFVGGSTHIPKEILGAADGMISHEDDDAELRAWTSRLEPINQRIDSIKQISEIGDSNTAFKVLRFIDSRDEEFTPVNSPNDTTGYVYPMLKPFFPKQDFGLIETLDYLHSQHLLSGRFIKKAYACTHCGCAFLNFYETCPDCSSGDLRIEELIHHFRCAYVGEKSDFKSEDGMICPKCDRALKHIGVDYDKASVMYHCNNCRNVFQEPQVMTACYNCSRETDPEYQVIRDIRAYTVTALGKNAALYGMDSLLQNILEKKITTIPFEVFKLFFKVEIARIERYKQSQSCLCMLRLDAINRIYEKIGKRSTEIFDELSDAFKASLRASDLFSVKDETIFLIILTETSHENAQTVIGRLKDRVQSLMHANLNLDCRVASEIQAIVKGVDIEKTIEKFLKTHAA
ncbi:TackOD1 domain-containing metal-binding protein [Desulfobacter sp.]